MHRAALALLAILACAVPGAAKDDPQPEICDVPSDVDLVAPPRVVRGQGGHVGGYFVAMATAAGIDIADSWDFMMGDGHVTRRRVAGMQDILAGGRRGPRIAVSTGAVVVAAITKRAKDSGGDLLAWRSTDSGRTWSGAVRINDVPGSAAEGLFDLVALGDERFAAVWLDLRDEGKGREKGMRLRADFSADGAKWGEDVLAYEAPGGSVCECCHPAIAGTPDGGAILGFRNSVKGDRDIWTMRLARGAVKFTGAAKSGKGSWRIAGCPMAGPAVGVRTNDPVAAWRRETHVFVAEGDEKERDVGEGTEPQVMVLGDGVHVFWLAKDALVHLAPNAKAPVEIAKNASFPCTSGRVVAWLDTATRRARMFEIR